MGVIHLGDELFDESTGEFFFLEVNTRLQVEHPVTELVTGVDLVREQIRIAFGEPLAYSQADIAFTGSAIEARLYAEDPDNSFFPASGQILAFDPPSEPAVRWDSGFDGTSRVGTDFDPMLAKVISHAPTRREAARKLANALSRTHLGGPVTNRNYLVSILQSEAFVDGDTTTDFVTRVALAAQTDIDPAELSLLGKLAAIWIERGNRQAATVLRFAPSGWRNTRMPDQRLDLSFHDTELALAYHVTRDGHYRFADGATATLHGWSEGEIDAEIDGLRRRARITRAGDRILVSATLGDVLFDILPRFREPSRDAQGDGFVSPMPGRVVSIHREVGDEVAAGDVLMVLEAMKMQHSITATYDGVVRELRVAADDQVDVGTLLIVVEAPEDAQSEAG